MKPTEVALEALRRRHESAERRRAARTARAGRALCLSGGGYRAALFHLGALLRLHETGHLAGTTLISSVSGGSIVAAWLALRHRQDGAGRDFEAWCREVDFRAVVVEPFRDVVARDLRTWPVLRTLPGNWLWPSRRIALLERAYVRVFGELTLRDLPASPAFVFCATDLTFGVNWIFSRRRVGDYLAGYVRGPGAIRWTRAIAASSSFPPVFGPLRFAAAPGDFRRGRHRGPDADRLRARIDLSDGGVYDNLATEPALRSYAQVLVSDAGAPFAFETRRWFLRRLLRYTQVVSNQAGALRKRLWFAQRHFGAFDGAHWGLTSARRDGEPGYAPALVRDVLSRVRTDLDRFLRCEFDVLVNHGYFNCHNALQRESALVPDGAPLAEATWPYPDARDEAHVRHALRHSHRRVWHWRWFARRDAGCVSAPNDADAARDAEHP